MGYKPPQATYIASGPPSYFPLAFIFCTPDFDNPKTLSKSLFLPPMNVRNFFYSMPSIEPGELLNFTLRFLSPRIIEDYIYFPVYFPYSITAPENINMSFKEAILVTDYNTTNFIKSRLTRGFMALVFIERSVLDIFLALSDFQFKKEDIHKYYPFPNAKSIVTPLSTSFFEKTNYSQELSKPKDLISPSTYPIAPPGYYIPMLKLSIPTSLVQHYFAQLRMPDATVFDLNESSDINTPPPRTPSPIAVKVASIEPTELATPEPITPEINHRKQLTSKSVLYLSQDPEIEKLLVERSELELEKLLLLSRLKCGYYYSMDDSETLVVPKKMKRRLQSLVDFYLNSSNK